MPALSFYRNPNWGDTVTTDFRQLTRRNMENQVNTFRSTFWPVTSYFRFEISALSNAEVETIISFLRANAGQLITVTDYNGVVWTCLVVDDPKIEQTGQGCQYKLSMTVEGSYVVPA